MIHNRAELTSFIKQQALSLGFDACGIAKADFLKEDTQFLEQWLSKGFHADMNYLARNKENRVDPRIMVEGCKSIVVVILNYFPALTQSVSQPKISKYAYSKVDYHTVIKSKLKQLEESIRNNFGDECFHPKRQHLFVDSAPVLERRWAQRAGLGWIGKNKMLIHPQFGSFFFLGEMFLNVELEFDEPYIKNGCGNCTKCLDSCPTQALNVKNGLDANKCISYQTIENKQDIDVETQKKLSGFAYGCDICNDVCPWNKSRAKSHNPNGLEANKEMLNWTENDWKNLTKEQFDIQFKDSAVQRAGFEKLKKNIQFTLENE